MMINTNTIVSVSEANQNFSRVTRIADAQGQAVIFKNNRFADFSVRRTIL